VRKSYIKVLTALQLVVAINDSLRRIFTALLYSYLKPNGMVHIDHCMIRVLKHQNLKVVFCKIMDSVLAVVPLKTKRSLTISLDLKLYDS